MPFLTELDLVDCFVSWLYRSGSLSTGVRLVREIETGNGIPDIVLFRPARLAASEKRRIADTPNRFAILLDAKVFPQEISLEGFSRLTGLAGHAAPRLLRRLVSSGAIVNDGYAGIRIRQFKKDPVELIVSVEAKLSDWRRALFQANRYLDYSHQSWVLLDTARVNSALENIEVFRKHSIGLASINVRQEVFIHLEPGSEPPRNNPRFWSVSSRLLRIEEAVSAS